MSQDTSHRLTKLSHHRKLATDLTTLSDNERTPVLRELLRTNLFFLLWYGCGRKDIYRQWLLDRCNEVQANPNGYLDLWAREHYKSTIITFGQVLQDVLSSHGDDPDPKWEGREVTVGIFSHTRPIAKGFLRQIKLELEGNDFLQRLFPDILYDKPHKDAPKWSEDDGLILRRKSNPKESTIEAHGLVDGQPTGKHFFILNYDDVVTDKSVTRPEMIKKTTDALELSYNLGTDGGYKRFVGTKYHLFDTYRTIAERQTVKVRLYPATKNGKADGEPVLIRKQSLDEKRRDMGPYTFGCQMLLDPQSDMVQGFDKDWIKHHRGVSDSTGNRYIIFDPANEKKKSSDYTAATVIELRQDKNYYELESVRDRLSLTERTKLLFDLHRKWGIEDNHEPPVVGYEKYGKDSDIEHIEDVMLRDSYSFEIIPLGGSMAKNDRIRKLIPIFEQGRYLLPENDPHVNYEGRQYDSVKVFLSDEYYPFPVLSHDDMFDCKARILDEDLDAKFPVGAEIERPKRQSRGFAF